MGRIGLLSLNANWISLFTYEDETALGDRKTTSIDDPMIFWAISFCKSWTCPKFPAFSEIFWANLAKLFSRWPISLEAISIFISTNFSYLEFPRDSVKVEFVFDFWRSENFRDPKIWSVLKDSESSRSFICSSNALFRNWVSLKSPFSSVFL